MGRYVMVSLWYESDKSSLTSTRFKVLYFRMNDCQAHFTLKENIFQTAKGGY